MTGINKIMRSLHVRGIGLEELETKPSRREDGRKSQVQFTPRKTELLPYSQ